MRNIWRVLAALPVLALACNNEATTSQEIKPDSIAEMNEVIPADSLISGCYSLTAKRDTASFQLQVKGQNARGSLSYHLFEKDRNDGTFEGEIRNGLLTGWYLFRSEGIMSVRQIAWKVGKDSLWPAIGEMGTRNDTTMFVNMDKLSYDSSQVFVKVKCVI